MSPLRLILCSHVSPNRHQKYLTTRRRQRHSAYLWVLDLYRWGRQIFEDPAPMAVTRAPSSGFIIASDPCTVSYIRTANIVRGIPVVTSILRPLVRASSSSTSTLIPDPDLSDDYLEIENNAYGEPAECSRLICMVASNGDRSNNTFSKYPTIGRSKAFDARTPSDGLVWNLNLDFNVVRV
jgi:hypothetical protein